MPKKFWSHLNFCPKVHISGLRVNLFNIHTIQEKKRRKLKCKKNTFPFELRAPRKMCLCSKHLQAAHTLPEAIPYFATVLQFCNRKLLVPSPSHCFSLFLTNSYCLRRTAKYCLLLKNSGCPSSVNVLNDLFPPILDTWAKMQEGKVMMSFHLTFESFIRSLTDGLWGELTSCAE